MDIIRLLPDAIANQIAAGEVVQRPASVVKELLENSLDAGATAITLVIKEAGRQLVQVIDDGSGMSETDARMCFERHATSKIRTAEDLWAIQTMGFRGEAMASIAAVARVEMRTRKASDEIGTEIYIEGSTFKSTGPVATPPGTSISVKDLFFNTPARRNFLKSNTAELRHILEEFTRIALARPEIALYFFRGEEEYLRLPKAKLAQRIAGLFGKSYSSGLVPVQEAAGHFSVQGYMGKPELAKKIRGEQFFFVNGRYIKHPFLHHAVASAMEGLLPADFHPFYTLFIQTDPARLDVNVHPTKTEVKFEDERQLYAILYAAVRKSMSDFHVAQPIDFEHNINFGLEHPKETPPAAESAPTPPPRWEWPLGKSGSTNLDDWRRLPDNPFAPGIIGRPNFYGQEGGSSQNPTRPELGSISIGAGGTLFPLDAAAQAAEAGKPQTKATFQFSTRYIATAVKSGLMLIDIGAARERIFYEKFMRRGKEEALSQQTIFPVDIELSPTQALLLEEIWEEITQLGFTLEWQSRQKITVLGAPPEAYSGTEKELLEGLLEQYLNNKDALRIPKKEQVARALAHKAAYKTLGRELDIAEQESLIGRLFSCQVPHITPDGRPVSVLLHQQAIQGWFGAIEN